MLVGVDWWIGLVIVVVVVVPERSKEEDDEGQCCCAAAKPITHSAAPPNPKPFQPSQAPTTVTKGPLMRL